MCYFVLGISYGISVAFWPHTPSYYPHSFLFYSFCAGSYELHFVWKGDNPKCMAALLRMFLVSAGRRSLCPPPSTGTWGTNIWPETTPRPCIYATLGLFTFHVMDICSDTLTREIVFSLATRKFTNKSINFFQFCPPSENGSPKLIENI